ncbi:uncharacterized protein PFL1_06347 [Pseudozyma flocculosa PF-1]|uniref:Related to DUF962 domain protein n=2 Tax=Pseudozyma flocculosa TaxID=84751 RepID=A0A5C3F8J5_9BASI|nr:uncharacterized protein PFL1_06347 [Pseudozyma flocculosa PF-1]EPQ26139.1 hypothetical protein PFL1_06347 [Pseudozyma flocculosa PF-1]SPO40386.1 related to DUF962 domain protein [Pseudozyma flocculosa]
MASINPFSLRKQLAFYGAYHTDTVNVLIHVVGVPSIIFGVCVLLASRGSLFLSVQRTSPLLASYLSLFGSQLASILPKWAFEHARLDASTVFMSSYLAYYTVLDPVAATLYTPVWYSIWYGAETLLQTRPDVAVKVASMIFVGGWIAQFYGHGVHEKRAPALLDNLLGAVVLAPFFVWLEVIFHLGYRPQLQKDLKNDVGKLVTQFRKEQADKERRKIK